MIDPSAIIHNDALSASTKVRALALLELAHPDNGHITAEWQELGDLWACASGTVRRQLGVLQAAGLIHYSSNGDGLVYVTFKFARAHARKCAQNAPEGARPRAETDAPPPEPPANPSDGARVDARKDAHNVTESARPRAEMRAKDAAPSHADAGAQLDGWMDGSTIQDGSPSIQPAPPPAPLPTLEPTEEQALAFALLAAVRMRPEKIRQFAATIPFAVIREAVGAWWTNRKAAGGQFADQPGIVAYWLDKYPDVVWPAPTPAWERDELCQRFRTRAERDADQPEPAAPADQPEPTHAAPEPAPDDDPPALAIWRYVIRTDARIVSRWSDPDAALSALDLAASSANTLVLRIDAQHLDWSRRKLLPAIRRAACVTAGAPVTIEFVPQELTE